jgi:hypothetical protein
LAFAGLLSVAVPAFGQSASPDKAEAFIQKWDRSGKGLLGLKEVDNAAIVRFEMLDKNHQGRLTESDLSALLSPEQFKQPTLIMTLRSAPTTRARWSARYAVPIKSSSASAANLVDRP